MTKNLADELGRHGINVTVVHPGITRTERATEEFASRATGNTIGRIVDADEVAYVVAFLASPKSGRSPVTRSRAGVGHRGRSTTDPSSSARR